MSVTAHALFYFINGRTIMADTYKIESLLNTTAGMTAIVNNSKKGNVTINVAGVDWFVYANKTVSTIYINGNNWIGFGQSTKQLKICYYNGAVVYYIYRQEGTLESGKRFLKIRVEGYTNYSSKDAAYTLKYEVFLIEGQTLFINIIQHPTNSSYIGQSTITDGTNSANLHIAVNSEVPLYILVKNAGNAQVISYERYVETITKIAVTTPPSRTTYYQKEVFDRTGMVVTAYYDDGSTVEVTDYEVTNFDSSSASEELVTLTYEGLTTTLNVTVLDIQVTGISAASNKELYLFNENLSPSNVTLTGNLSNGGSVELNSNLAEYTGFKKGFPGEQTITARYSEFTTTFNVMSQAPVIEDLLNTKAEMTYVLNNQKRNGYIVSTEGVDWFKYGIRTANMIYVASNGWVGFGRPQEHLSLFQFSYRIEDTSIYSVLRQEGVFQSGKRFLKVRVEGYAYKNNSYSNYAYTYEVFLIEGQTLFVYIPKLPVKCQYNRDNVAYVYDGNKKEYIDSVKATNNGGVQPVSVLIENAGICQHVSEEMYTDKTYTGIEVTNPPDKTIYTQGDNFDASGMIVSALDSSGAKTPITNYSVTDFDSGTGDRALPVIYQGLKTTLNVTINAKDILKITKLPTKVTYATDEEFSSSGMECTLYKADGTKEVVTSECTLSSPSMSVAGRQVITATYRDCSAVFFIDVGSNIEAPSVSYKKRVPFSRGTIGSDGKLSVNKNAREVIVPKGVTGDAYDLGVLTCSELTSIHFPNTLKMVSTQSFYSAASLIDINLPPSLNSVWSSAFTSLPAKEIWIQGISLIQTQAFYNWFMATRIYLSSTVTEMQTNCFGLARKLKSLVIPKSVTTITTQSLLDLTALEKIYFMNPSLTNIGLTKVDGLKIYGFTGSTAETYANTNLIDFVALGDFQSLELVTAPKKTKYKIGDIFDVYGIELQATYSSGEKVSVPPDSITGFDSTVEGTQTVTLNYESASVSFEVEVLSATGIEITSLPARTKFKIEEDFDEDGLIVSEVYSDGTKEKIVDFTLSGYDSSTVGTKNITASYDGNTASFPVEISLDNALIGITVIKLPDKTEYKPGDTFTSDGLQIGLLYSDGTVTPSSSIGALSNPNMSELGKQSVFVTYSIYSSSDGRTITYATSFEINVENAVASIEVLERYGNVKYFFIGDENTGTYRYAVKSIKVVFVDGTEKTVSYPDFTETEVDTSKAGDFYTTLTYAGKEIRNPYTVYGSPFITKAGYPNADDITVTLNLDTGLYVAAGTGTLGRSRNSPMSTMYKIKTMEIKEGITGFSYLTDYSSVITLLSIPSTIESISNKDLENILGSGYSNATIRINAKKGSIPGAPWGQTKATIVWVAKPEKLNIETLPTQTRYMTGDTLSLDGLKCNILYSNGKTYTPDGEVSYSPVDMTAPGKQLVTLSCVEDGKTLTTTFNIEIVSRMAGIRISSFPSKIYYKIGESLDLSGLEVVVVDGLGNESALTDYTVSGFDSSKAGVKTITVSYQTEIDGVETFVGYDEFEIKVTKDGTNPFEDNTDPINVKVHWINGEFEDLTNDNIQSNTLSLQESLCNKAYFIFGGCISNQITFKCYHQQFIGTDEATYPSGKIEVYIECKGTEIKIFTGEIATGERDANSFVRTIVAYDYLYKLRNTDIAWWYKNNTKDKQMVFTQKQFRDALFKYLGIEQVDVKLKYDSAYVPNTANSSEMNVANILEDLCLQNNVFGWMNRDGKFEYKKLKKNCKHRGTTVSGVETFNFYESAVHLDRFKSFKANEGRVWYFNYVYTDPDPSGEVFTSGEPTAQDAYERNVFYNRNSFFVGNQDWLNYAYDANEYGDYTRTKPKYEICYGTVAEDIIKKQYYRAQGYSVEVQGNPFNMVGQTVEMTHSKFSEDGSAIQWVIHSYIMSRTLKLGITGLIDTYSANNSPYNGNNQQLGKNTPEITSTINRTRSEMPTISYAEFTDGSDSEFSPATIDDFTDGSGSTSDQLKKAQLRCVKRIKKADYDALVAAGTDRKDTLYFTFEEG